MVGTSLGARAITAVEKTSAWIFGRQGVPGMPSRAVNGIIRVPLYRLTPDEYAGGLYSAD